MNHIKGFIKAEHTLLVFWMDIVHIWCKETYISGTDGKSSSSDVLQMPVCYNSVYSYSIKGLHKWYSDLLQWGIFTVQGLLTKKDSTNIWKLYCLFEFGCLFSGSLWVSVWTLNKHYFLRSDMSLGMVCSTYSVDIPRNWHGHISIAQMKTLVHGVEISIQCSYLLSRIGEVTFSLWYIKIIQIQINNCFK